MSSQARRKKALELLNECCEASRRPLFSELELLRNQQQCESSSDFPSKVPRTWNVVSRQIHSCTYQCTTNYVMQMIRESSNLTQFLTDSEHGKLLKICSIFLLGYLLPHSTGNDFYLLQTSTRRPNDESDIEHIVINVPLSDRLDVGFRSYNAAESSMLDINTPQLDPFIRPYFDRFLDCLGVLLTKRPLSSGGVDLLHVIAMAIHPCPELKHMEVETHPSAQVAQRLATHIVAYQLYVPNRQRIIQLVSESMALPSLEDETQVGYDALMKGALPHLLASLHARGGCDYSCSQLVARTRNVRRFIEPEWERLFSFMVAEREGQCRDCTKKTGNCPYMCHGELMSILVKKCSSLPGFRDHVVASLADVIEWQLDSWKEPSNHIYPPCRLASLVRAAEHIFWPSRRKQKKSLNLIVGKSIQLLVHPSSVVAKQAERLLLRFFTCARETETAKFASSVAAALQLCRCKDSVGDLVGIVASQSVAFADETMAFALDGIDSDNHQSLASWVDIIAMNSPSSAKVHKERLEAVITNDRLTEDNKLSIGRALLAVRLSHYFTCDVDLAVMTNFHATLQDPWSLYRLAVSALFTGNHSVAADSLLQLHMLDLSESHFLWTSTLLKVSMAGTFLVTNGAMGIPDANSNIASAIEYIEHVTAIDKAWIGQGSFQKTYLRLFMDFLDLTTVARHIAREVRLSAQVPRKTTRTMVHLRGVVRALGELSNRFKRLRTRFGATFRFSESARIIDLFGSVCRFLEYATQAVFPDIFRTGSKGKAPFVCEGHHPLACLMRKLDALMLEPMSISLDPVVRAAALIELIDGILKAPFPFPRDFIIPLPEEFATLNISPEDLNGIMDDDSTAIIICPAFSVSFLASGQLPQSFLQRCRSPIRSVLLWFRIRFRAPPEPAHEEEQIPDQNEIEPATEPTIPDLSSFSPVQTRLLPDGNFCFTVTCPPLAEEGTYDLHVKLGCRDMLRNEWEIPLTEKALVHTLRVSRGLDSNY